MLIETHDLIKCYPRENKNALDGVSLTIEEGCFFALLGPNGSGKTTFISILCGLLKANSGAANICGYNVHQDMHLIKPLIGLVPQQLALYPSLTLKENLTLFGKLYDLNAHQLKQNIASCLHTVELESVYNKVVSTFSGGMMRRANLAVGLLHQPKVLFLDEPTVNVDAHARNMIFESLRKINQQGVTIVYTTHYLEEVETLCDQLAILNNGRIVAKNTVHGIKKAHPHLNNLSEIYLSLTSIDHE